MDVFMDINASDHQNNTENMYHSYPCLKRENWDVKKVLGTPGWLAVERLPSAQGMILGSEIEFHIWLLAESLLLPLPMSLPLSLSVSHE